MNKPTVSIKKHLSNPNIDYKSKNASRGIAKYGLNYSFSYLSHLELIDVFEQSRRKKGLSKVLVSQKAGYSKSVYTNVVKGSRLSKKSYNSFCKVLGVLDYDPKKQAKIDFDAQKKEHTVIEVCTLEKSIAMIKKAPINSDIVQMAVEVIKNAPESDDIFNLIYHLISRNNTYDINVSSAIQIVKNSIQSTGKIHPVLFHVFKNAGYKIQKSELIWKDVTVENYSL